MVIKQICLGILLCWSVRVPQSFGKATPLPEGDLKVMVSLEQVPLVVGCLMAKVAKSSLTWQIAENQSKLIIGLYFMKKMNYM